MRTLIAILIGLGALARTAAARTMRDAPVAHAAAV